MDLDVGAGVGARPARIGRPGLLDALLGWWRQQWRRDPARHDIASSKPLPTPIPIPRTPPALQPIHPAMMVTLVPEELLPPCFADTCADWTLLAGEAREADKVPTQTTHFSLSDWSAPTDRVEPDTAPTLAPMSCTMPPQAHSVPDMTLLFR